MTDSSLQKLPEKRSVSSVIVISLVIGFAILIVCQLAFLGLAVQQRTRINSTVQDRQSVFAQTATTLTSSDIQLVSCSDDDLCDAVVAVKFAVVNIDVVSSDVGPSANRGGPPLSFDVPSPQALQANDETLGSGVVVDPRGYVLTCYHLIKDYPKV